MIAAGVAFAMLVATVVIAPPTQASHVELCYVFADSGNRLGILNRATGVETAFPNAAGVSNIEAMELDPTTGILYAIDADELGILNQTTGIYSAVGLIGSGDPGAVPMDDVDSMAFDSAGNLWGVNASGGRDELFRIDTATGAIIPDTFGPGIDFLPINGGFEQIDDIGIDPGTGIMYGINTSGTNDQIVTINTTTGLATAVGSGTGVSDMEGMTFDTSGQLIGTTGSNGPAATNNSFFTVNKTTGVATFEVALGVSGGDYESATCSTQGIHVSDLELSKTVSNTTPASGEIITFTVTVTNQGEDDATGVEVVDQLPAGLLYVSDDSGGDYAPGSGVWDIGNLANGASVVLQIQAQVVGSGSITNVAEVTASNSADPDSIPNNDDGDQSEDDEDNATITAPTSADLELAKTVDDPSPNIGDTVTFTVTVTNQGQDAASGISVEDVVPAGYSNITNLSGGGALVGSTITWTGISLANGASIDLTFDADVDAPTGTTNEYLNVAEITASSLPDPDSTPDNDDGDQSEDDEDNASVTPSNVIDLELDKSVSDTTPDVGDTVTFTVVVSNQGPAAASGVSVEDVVPAGYSNITNISGGGALVGSTITWTGISLANGATLNLTFDADVDIPTGGANEYVNISEVTAADQFDIDSTPDNDDGDQSEDDEDNATITPPGVADLELSKTVSDTTPGVGDTVTFTVTVTNQGPDTATGVAVEDVVPAGYSNITNISGGGTLVGSTITWTGISLANGASTDLTFDADVDAPTGAADEYLNVAEVTAADQFDIDSTPNNDDGDQSEDDEDNATVIPEVADLELTKSVDDSTPDVGDTVTFTITLSNQGPDDATGVSIADVVPAGFSNITNISGGGTLGGSTITWTGISLANGATLNLTFDADVDIPTGTANEYLNIAEVTAADQFDIDSTPNNDDGDQSEDDEDNATITPPGVADLELTKTVNVATPNVGDTVTFTITVTNQGPDTATGVAVEDVVPSGYSNITNISGGGTLIGSTITWTGISLANGASLDLTFDADVDAPTGTASEYLNIAEVTASDQFDTDSTPNNDDGDQSEDDEDNATVTPLVTDLELTKAVDNTTPGVGDTVTFTVTVTNQGPDAATGVAVEDVVPAGYSNITNISNGGTLIGSTITWTGISLANGASTDLTFDADVDAPTGTANEYLNVAEVTASDQFDIDSTPNNDDGDQSEDDEDNAEVTPPGVADLNLNKMVSDSTPNVGDTVTFTITVSNEGPDDATGVAVEDLVPAGYSNITNISGGGTLVGSTITWTGISLANGASIDLTFDADVDAPTGTTDEYLNIAQVNAADQFDPDSTPNNDDGDQNEDDEDNAVVTPLVTDLELTKSVDDSSPDVGDTVTFTITLSNQGPDTATGVAVEDLVPAGYSNITNISNGGTLIGSTITWTGISLANGASIDLTFDADVNLPTGTTDEYLNVAEVTASDQFDTDSTPNNDDGDQSEDDEDNAAVTPPGVADLELAKVVDNSSPDVGDTVTFTITVTNQGPDAATGVAVEDVVPAGFSNITNISGGGILVGSTITWTGISLANGASLDLTFDADVDAPTGAANEYVNVAEVTASDQFDTDSTPNNDDGDQSEDDEDNATVNTPEVADLELVKTVSAATPNVGDTVTFTVTVTNQGPDAATGVRVQDTVPAGYSNIANVSSGGSVFGGDIVRWTNLTLASGSSLVLTFEVDVDAPTGSAGEYLNVAEVLAADQFDPDSTPNNDDGDQSEDDEDNAAVTPLVADLELTKAVDNTTPGVGDTVTFTVTVTNQGSDTATGVAVEDVVPAGYSNITNISGGGTLVGSTITWTGISLANGASIDLTFDADVDAPTGTANEYLNTAEVTASDQFDIDSTPNNDDGDQSEDDEDNATVNTPEVADLELVKSVSTDEAGVGDTVTFTVTVTNQGPDTATGVAVEDLVPAGYSNISNISGGGTLVGSTITWTGISLANGASIDLTFDADVDAPTGAANEYVNIAEVTTADQFDTDSTPDNDDGDQSEDDEDNAGIDVTELGIAKAVAVVTNNSDGTYTVSYVLTVENLGNVTITDLVVTDDLTAQLTAIAPTGFNAVSGSLDANPGWDGTGATNVLTAGQSLAAGESGTVLIFVTVTPGADFGPHLNQASVSGTTPDDGVVTDESTDGDDPDPNDDGNPAEDDPTPVLFAEQPSIGLAKQLTTGPDSLGSGVFSLGFTLLVENTGDVPLDQLQVSDDLAATFAGATGFTVTSVSSSDFTVNSGYDGSTDTNLLDGTDTLAVGATGTIVINLEVTPGTDVGPYDNTATATGTSPANAIVTDDSQDGADVDPDGNGDPTDNNDPTPVVFPEPGAVEGRLWIDEDRDGVQDAGELGIPNVTIELVDPGPDGVIGGGDDTVIASTSTDSNGDYLFDNLDPGNYVVVVSSDEIPTGLMPVFDPDGTFDHSTPVTVIAGETDTANDFGYDDNEFDLVVDKDATISGESVVWTITVTNAGPDEAPAPITMIDDLPDSLSIEAVIAPTGWSCEATGQLVECSTNLPMTSGASATFELRTVTSASDGTIIENVANVLSTGVETDPNNNTDAAAVTVGPLPFTGFGPSRFIVLAIELLLLGSLLLVASRRRRSVLR